MGLDSLLVLRAEAQALVKRNRTNKSKQVRRNRERSRQVKLARRAHRQSIRTKENTNQ